MDRSRFPLRRFFTVSAWLAGATLLVFVGFLTWRAYRAYRAEQNVERAAQQFSAAEESARAVATNDREGGATPQGTLTLFIGAATAQNFEQAGTFFVLDERERWRTELESIAAQGNLESFLQPLREAATAEGEYSASGDRFSVHTPVAVDFVRYPSGVWKIVRI